ncbi:sensor histidine kinase [Agathobaculum butyriciproducens]|uniref:GHKL domain-containing protein n=3 Tax=Agathobaculum butyriciproducens TaxID=1628085 RepID=A0AAW4W2L3_9FIRM|nr:GHKL domain-containing protein [Agathobaculum butyriciproducens]
MQTLGYLISALGPIYLEWFCFEKIFHRRDIKTPIMFLLFSLGALLLTLQTQFAYSMFLNPTANILVAFALTFLYKGVWYQRLFISFTLFVVAVLGEGSAWLTGQFFFTVKDMTHANEEQHFLIICILAVIFELVYVCIILSFIKYFKKHACKLNTFILFLIAILTYCIILLFVTFTDTAYLVPALILCVLLISAIAGCIYLFNDQLRVQRERMQLAHLEEMQQDQVQHYTALYEANRQVAVQRHDLKNILLNVRSYIEVGEIEKLDKYVAKFQEKLQPSKMIDNGMPFIDAVLSAKMAEHTEIPFELHIAPLQLEHLTQPQIAFILATALDNAIEACAQSAKPFIKVRLNQQGHMVSLVVVNAADQPIKAIGDTLLTTKADAASHGYGIKSMKQAAEQAHGMLTWKYEQQTFTLSVLLQDIAE